MRLKSNSAVPAALRWLLLPLATSVLISACGGGGMASVANRSPLVIAKLGSEAVLYANTLFDTAGTTAPDGSITSRNWAYGDGLSGSADNHTYTAAGDFSAVLTVTDNHGASASTAVPVTVTKCSIAGTQAAKLSPFNSVCMQTSLGELVLELYTAQAPLTVANFLRYVDEGFYKGLLFHRVIHEGGSVPGGVIQGGGYLPGLTPKAPSHPAIALESNNGLKNTRYTVAMARTSAPDSATSQFFINPLDNQGLDYNAAQTGPNGYAVFGLVISGTAVVDAIGSVATATTVGRSDVPVQDVLIQSIVRMP